MNDDNNEAREVIAANSNSNPNKAASPAMSPVPFDDATIEDPKRKNTSTTNETLPKPRKASRKKPFHTRKKKHRKPQRWSAKEHEAFCRGLEIYGRDWEAISKMDGIINRTKQLVGSHAQRHFINLWRRNEQLPLKVQASGTGYTLSGKPLNPNSSAVKRRKSSSTPQKLRALHANNAKALKQLKRKASRTAFRRRKRGKLRHKTDKNDDDAKQDPEERKKRKKRNKTCKANFRAFCNVNNVSLQERKDMKKVKILNSTNAKKKRKPVSYQRRMDRVQGKIHSRVNPNKRKQKIGISYSLPMEVEGFKADSGAVKHLAPLFIRPKYLGIIPQHDTDVTFLSHFHKIWFTNYRRLKKQIDPNIIETHFDRLNMTPIDAQNIEPINMKPEIVKRKKKRSDKEEMSDTSDEEDIEMNTIQACDTERVSIIYNKNDNTEYSFDSHYIPLSYSSLAMPSITKSLAKKRRFHVVYFNFKSKGVIIVHKVLKKWGLINGELRRNLMHEYGGTYKKIKNLHEIFKIAKQNKIKTGIFMIHFRYHPLIGIQTFSGDLTHVLNAANVVLFVRFQDSQGYISKADREQNARIREAQKQGKELIVRVPKDSSIAHHTQKQNSSPKQNKEEMHRLSKVFRKSLTFTNDDEQKEQNEFRITVNADAVSYTMTEKKRGKWRRRTVKRSNEFKVFRAAERLVKGQLTRGWKNIPTNDKYTRKEIRSRFRRKLHRNKKVPNDALCEEDVVMKKRNHRKRTLTDYEDRDIFQEHEPLLKKRKMSTNNDNNKEDIKNNRNLRARSDRSRSRSKSRSRSRSRGRNEDQDALAQKMRFQGMEHLTDIGHTAINQTTIDKCQQSVDAVLQMKLELKTPSISPLTVNPSISLTQLYTPNYIQKLIAIQMQPQYMMLNPFVVNNLTQIQPQNVLRTVPVANNMDYAIKNPLINNIYTSNMTSNMTSNNENDELSEDQMKKEPKKIVPKKKKIKNKRKRKKKKKEKHEMVDVVLQIKRNKRINVKIELIVGYDVFTKQLSQSQQTLMNTILQHFALHLQKYLKTKRDRNQPFYGIHTRDTFNFPLAFTEEKQKVKDREFTETTYYVPFNVTPCKSYTKWYAHHHWYQEQKQISHQRHKKCMKYHNRSKMKYVSDEEQDDHYVEKHDDESETDYVQQIDTNKVTEHDDEMKDSTKQSVSCTKVKKNKDKEEEDEIMKDDECEDDDRYRDQEAKRCKRWMDLRSRASIRERMLSGKRCIWVGGTAYHDLFTEEELREIELTLDKIQIRSMRNKHKRHTSQSTVKRSSKSGLLVRTKHFFGARYLWHPSEFKLEGRDKSIGAGLRVDVDDKPDELFQLCEQKLVKYGVIAANWIQGIAFNMYHDGTEGLGPHFDDELRFDRPIITIRLFSDARIAFGTDLYGTTNGTVSIPLPRGCVLSLQKSSFVADAIKHTIRPCDMYAKSAAIILRRFQQKALQEAKQLHQERLQSGYYDVGSSDDNEKQVNVSGSVKKKKREPILYGGGGRNAAIRQRITVEDNEYTTADGFCVPDDYVEFEDKYENIQEKNKNAPMGFYKKNNRLFPVFDLTDDNDNEHNHNKNNNNNNNRNICHLMDDTEFGGSENDCIPPAILSNLPFFDMFDVQKMLQSQIQIHGANGDKK